MPAYTRREVFQASAATGLAALAPATVLGRAAKTNELANPFILRVEKGVTLDIQLDGKPYQFTEGTYRDDDFPLPYAIQDGKLCFTEPTHNHRIKLARAGNLDYVILTASASFNLRVDAIYKPQELNGSRCCFQCQGLLVCVLPGTCVRCGVYTFCCP